MTEQRKKILIVDDERLNINVLHDLLKEDYKTMAAISGKQALKAAESDNPPDLILLDIMMPEMDGYEVCETLKSNDKTKDIPIIFVTAMGQTSDETKGLGYGAVDYLTKPVSGPIVHARVKTHLELKRQRDELKSAYRVIESQKERMEDELLVGREIQMSMVPQEFPPFPDRHEFRLHAKLFPAREVGGDFYDYFLIDEDCLCLCIGDVSGKGVPAALFMAVTRTLIKARATEDRSTASIITRVNDELARDNKKFMFVTLFLALVEISTGRVTYTNAGHNPTILRRKSGDVELLDAFHGPVVAASPELAFKEDTIFLEAGDMLVIYTDGVTDTRNVEKEFFSQARLEKLVSNSDTNEAEQIVEGIFSELKAFEGEAEQFDDITLMVLSLKTETTTGRIDEFSITLENQLSEITNANLKFNEFVEKHSLTIELRRQFNLVIDELLNNIISYAYEDDEAHQIDVSGALYDNQFILRIRDDGIPFNPFTGPAPELAGSLEDQAIGGLGIHLVKNLMDQAIYRREINQNLVTLIKKLQ